MATMTCKWCRLEKEPIDFPIARSYKSGRKPYCNKCISEYYKRWRKTHPLEARIKDKERRLKYIDARREYMRRDYIKNGERRRGYANERNRRCREEVIEAYGGRCACCGETERRFLTLDHMNNDGKDHRKAIGRRSIYVWLVTNGLPPGFQILCANCNMGRYWNGGTCPHLEAQYGITLYEHKAWGRR